ncbi:ATPase [Spirochaetia bacterium]|nr:ATPase [Spirochaetia bacterium]
MKFYDRKTEIGTLNATLAQSESSACFTMLVGRRRIGKTALVLESLKRHKSLYLFVSRQTEPLLCALFQEAAEKALGLRIYGTIGRFRDLFEQLLRYARDVPYTLVIDEFQDLERINPAIFSDIQELWDRYKDSAKINFIVSGSIYAMMVKIFEYGKEPLFGRMTAKMHLRPFRVSILKKILKDYNPGYTPEDLLCLYMLTGGVPKYIEWLMDGGAVTCGAMLDRVCRIDSPFLDEGKTMLISEFGREYGTYFSILQLIAGGKNTQAEIDSIIGKNTGSYLANLEGDYSLITGVKPLFSKPGSRNRRWKIGDQYLRFWFRFIYPHQALIETGRNDLLRKFVQKNYEQYSGLVLENYFHEKIAEEGGAARMGNYWDTRGENEIDLIALDEVNKTALVAEIKRNPKKIHLAALDLKAEKIRQELAGYAVEFRGLSMEDM